MSERNRTTRTPFESPWQRPPATATAISLALLATVALFTQGCGNQDKANTAAAVTANAVQTFKLFDHPDAMENPPPYGLRLDGVEWAVFSALGLDTTGIDPSATWSFSFEQGLAGVTATFNEDTSAFTISGIGYGGLDNDQTSGPGEVAIRFVYLGTTVDTLLNGLFVGDGAGVGSITFLDNKNGDVLNGITVRLRSFANADGLLFQFANDNHRLSCPGDFACDFPVGRGWLEITGIEIEQGMIDFLYHTDHQDWLFTGAPEI